jgi:flagellar biosynthesis protein FliP
MKDIKAGFLIGIGVFLALLVLGLAQSAVGRAVSKRG